MEFWERRSHTAIHKNYSLGTTSGGTGKLATLHPNYRQYTRKCGIMGVWEKYIDVQ